MNIDELIASRKILITCGTGGVGKTTLSAAIAIRAAIQGRNVAVITIDPAKRLATSLGLEALGDQPHDLTANLLAAGEKRGIRPTGQLWALMPDTRKTFESFVRTMAPVGTLADKVIANPIFQIFAKEFSGTNEYMAMERLYALSKSADFDFIVLDTPPSRNTLDFLDAPRLLNQFFEDRIVKWLVVPTNKIVATGMRKALEMLERLTGAGFISDLLEFASALFEVRVNFQANLTKVMNLLKNDSVGFLLVAAATPDTAPEAAHFIQSVEDHDFHFMGVALNRTLGYLKIDPSMRDTAGTTPGLQESLALLEALQKREELAVQSLKKILPMTAGSLSILLPELARDVHSMDDLLQVAEALENQ